MRYIGTNNEAFAQPQFECLAARIDAEARVDTLHDFLHDVAAHAVCTIRTDLLWSKRTKTESLESLSQHTICYAETLSLCIHANMSTQTDSMK